MNMNKSELLEALKQLKKVPSGQDYKTRSKYWMMCSQLSKNILSTSKGYEDIHNDLMNLLANEKNNLHKQAEDFFNKRSDLQMGAEVVRTKTDDIAYWQLMTEDWIRENMNDETATEKTVKSGRKTKGWRYIADGENAYLEMPERVIPLTDKKQKRGKNARCHLMDLLSFPERIGSVLLKEDFDTRLISLKEDCTPSSFVNAVRGINDLVEKGPRDSEFLTIKKDGCHINQEFFKK